MSQNYYSQAAAAPPIVELIPSSRDPVFITKQIQLARSQGYHCITPAPSCPVLRDGCAVMAQSVLIVDDTYVGEGPDRRLAALAYKRIYPISGKDGEYGLSKVSVEQIGVAMGASFDGALSYRLDDASVQPYCKHLAVGSWLGFDGTPIALVKSKAIDLRDGSPICLLAMERHERKALDELDKSMHRLGRRATDQDVSDARARGRERAMNEILNARLNIEENAETKAQLRAIRSAGIALSYTLDELRKPFIVFRLIFTAETDNPDNARVYAEKTADYMMSGRQSLYGGPRRQFAVTKPPLEPEPVAGDDFIDVGSDVGSDGPPWASTPPPEPDQSPTQQWATGAPEGRVRQPQRSPEPSQPTEPPFIFTFGPAEGQRLDSLAVTEKHLATYLARYEAAILDETKAAWLVENRLSLSRIKREVERRRLIRQGKIVDLSGLPDKTRKAAERAIAAVETRRDNLDKQQRSAAPAPAPNVESERRMF